MKINKLSIDRKFIYATLTQQQNCLMPVYAHTKKDCSESDWELLYGLNGHAERTAAKACGWGDIFQKRLSDPEIWLRVLGMYHDMGKASEDFQAYLRGECESTDHKTAAASYFYHMPIIGRLLAYAFAGHHSGLPCGCRLFDGVLTQYKISPKVRELAERNIEGCLDMKLPKIRGSREEVAVALMLLVRMLHSCLVDADWLATEEYMKPSEALLRSGAIGESLEQLSSRLEAYIHARESDSRGYVNEWRKRVHARCYEAAVHEPGVKRLNVPTGGGKTLSSLSYALRHAALHNLKRVIYVIPFTSIIEQTAREFREVLGENNVVEHHSSVPEESESEFNRFATENWDAPVVVTTGVQFFESLFASCNSRCRKVHNMAQSVIVLDEVQTLPPSLLGPCLAVLRELQCGYGCSLLLCTATQPAFENCDYFDIGWEPGQVHSLLGLDFERTLFVSLRRVRVNLLGAKSQGELLEHFLQQGVKSALFIVNLTRQAQELFELMQQSEVKGLYHLSARMCPAHRTDVLKVVRSRLQRGLPTVLVATRVVEAGVDISFPLVYRDRCGLDSLAQSAGRCNRHGELPIGEVYMYEASESEYVLPGKFVDLRNGVYAFADTMYGKEDADIFSAEVIEEYFRRFYVRREGGNRWDASGVLEACFSGARSLSWDFPQMAEDFRMIDGAQRSLLVPYGEEAEMLRDEILDIQAAGRKPNRSLFRRMQQLSVALYEADWQRVQKECLHKDAGVYMLCSPGAYHEKMGLRRDDESEDTSKIYVF